MASPGKPPTLNDDQRAVDIYRKAADILCTKGFGATSMSDIAEAVDLTKGGLYYYIKGKGALLYAIMSYALDRLEGHVILPAAEITDPNERLAVLVAGHLRLILDEPSAMRVLAGEEESLAVQHRGRIVERKGQFGKLLESTITEVAADRASIGPAIEPAVAAGCIQTMVEGVLDWYEVDGPLGREDLVDQ
ncbi:MAG: TetR/AcrR family transcriptional regulator, partial [Acidobacteriota bacterium]